MCLSAIITRYDRPLQVAHARIVSVLKCLSPIAQQDSDLENSNYFCSLEKTRRGTWY